MITTVTLKEALLDSAREVFETMVFMAMGVVKARIQHTIGSIEVSIPSVVQGRELRNSLGEGSGRTKVRVNIEERYCAEFSLMYREGNKS